MADTKTLPPLPFTDYSLFYEAPGDDTSEGWQEVVDAPGYTADQMRAYAADALAAQAQATDGSGPDYGPAWLGAAAARVQAQPEVAARHLREYAAMLAAQAQGEPLHRYEVMEALRKALNKLPRYSFWLGDPASVRRVEDKYGAWIEWQAAHELFDAEVLDHLLGEPAPQPAAQPVRQPLTGLVDEIRRLPTVKAPEIDGEESDGTPRYWRSRPYVSLTQLERLLRAHGAGQEGGAA